MFYNKSKQEKCIVLSIKDTSKSITGEDVPMDVEGIKKWALQLLEAG